MSNVEQNDSHRIYNITVCIVPKHYMQRKAAPISNDSSDADKTYIIM